MSPPALFAAIFMACAFTFAAAQSCRGRCGGEYYRGSPCQCDYECIVHEECCKDYESQCTTRDSCLGRCGEPFKRGRKCTCDSNCVKYNQCCSDYQSTCATDEAMNGPDSNTTPGETSSCDNVNNNNPKEPPVVEQQSDDPDVTPSTFSEGDDPYDYIMPLSTPGPQDDIGDDVLGQNPDDPYSESGLQDPEPIPESTSGYEPAPIDLPEPVTSDPTLSDSEDDSKLEPTAEEMFTQLPPTDEAPGGPSDNRPTQANTNLLPSDQADEGPTESTDASNPEEQSDPTHTSEPVPTSPQLTPTSTVSSQVSTEPTPSSEPYPGSPSGSYPTSSTPEIQPEGQPEVTEATPDDELLPEGQSVDESTSTTLQPEDPPSEPEDEDSPNADLNQSSTTTINPSLATTTAATVTSKPTTTDLASTGPTDSSSSSPGDPEPTSDSSPSETQDQADSGPEPEPASTAASKPTTGLASTGPTDGSSPSPANPEPTSGSSATTTDSSPSDTQDQADNGPEPASTAASKPTTDGSSANPEPTSGSSATTTDSSPSDTLGKGPEPGSESGPGVRGDNPDSWNGPGPSPTDPAQDQGLDDATPAPTNAVQSDPTTKPHSKPNPTKPPPAKPGQVKPTSKPKPKPVEIAPPIIDNIRDYQADDSNDTNLCSGRPASGITTLRNGTMVVFRGHYFWVLDRNRVPGPARGITETWGVPSPIDTVFTRCNCQGKTYIFKGAQYWRFNNDMVDAGYPKPISTGFTGLRGHITAALSVPEHRQRREAVYFFKRGGQVQKYSYQFGTRPTCGRKVQYAVYTVRTRTARQAVSGLGPPINIRVSWRGFPTTVTSAVSVPTHSVLDGYKYYVFSRSKYYNVRMDGEQPVIAPQSTTTPQKNSANDFFKCPKEV